MVDKASNKSYIQVNMIEELIGRGSNKTGRILNPCEAPSGDTQEFNKRCRQMDKYYAWKPEGGTIVTPRTVAAVVKGLLMRR